MLPKPVQIRPLKSFEKSVKQLQKRYPKIKEDLSPIIAQLTSGTLVGNRLQNISYMVYKAHILNSDAQRGKSGGYRLIYYVHLDDLILLVTIYSKSDKENITNEEIIEKLDDYFADESDQANKLNPPESN